MDVCNLFNLTLTDKLLGCFQLFAIINIIITAKILNIWANLDISSTINSSTESKPTQIPQPCIINKPHLFY